MNQPDSEKLLQQYQYAEDDQLDSYSDELIISRVIEGQTELYEIIIKRYNQRLYRIIRGYLTDENDVKDAMQTTYLKAFENLEQFRAEAKFSTWLIRIAINEALKKLEEQKHTSAINAVTYRENGGPIYKEENATPETEAIQKDMKKHLEKAIDALPKKYRSVFIMREIEQMSTRETAESLDISRVNVKVRLHRAKKMLRDQLEQMLGRIDLFSFKGRDCDAMTRQVMERIMSKK